MPTDHGKVQYLRLIGRLYADNRLDLRPGFKTGRPGRIPEFTDSPLIAELLDGEGKPLLRYGVPLMHYCTDRETLPERAVRASIPFPGATQRLLFRYKGIVIHEIAVCEQGPSVALTWKPPKRVSGEQEVTWRAEHPEDLPLEFLLRYSHTGGEVWQRLGLRTQGHTATVDFDVLPGGRQCRIAVLATDGVNSSIAESTAFRVPVKPCRAMIFSPSEGDVLAAKEPVVLRGQGFYLEERAPETEALLWSSSLDGTLGEGMRVECQLSPGKHRITLRAGKRTRPGVADVSVRVA